MVNNKAFTLLEIILAVSLAAVIATTTAVMLNISFKGYQIGDANDELSMHARILLDRITRELRYATRIKQANSLHLEFDTTVLEDNDPETVEIIKYSHNIIEQKFERRVNGAESIVAGGAEGIEVTAFQSQGKELFGGFSFQDTASPRAMIAASVSITLEDSNGATFTAESMAAIRNK